MFIPLLEMFHYFFLWFALLNTNGNASSIDFENLSDVEKFNFIQNAAQKLSINDKAKLVKSLLGNEDLQVILKPSQLNATNILSANVEQISLMDKPQMGVLLAAIAQRLKNNS